MSVSISPHLSWCLWFMLRHLYFENSFDYWSSDAGLTYIYYTRNLALLFWSVVQMELFCVHLLKSSLLNWGCGIIFGLETRLNAVFFVLCHYTIVFLFFLFRLVCLSHRGLWNINLSQENKRAAKLNNTTILWVLSRAAITYY